MAATLQKIQQTAEDGDNMTANQTKMKHHPLTMGVGSTASC
jgi:hypothetical protein